jgi:malonyl-CoA O-methyltransferase
MISNVSNTGCLGRPHDSRKVAEAFSRAADSYDSNARIQRLALKECVQLLSRRLAAGSNVLDVGCGTGYLAHLMPGRDWNLTGIDASYGMCEKAASRMPVVNANGEALPFAEGAFHGAICSLVLQWANEPRVVLEEMARVVAPGGSCGLVVLGPETLRELKQAFTAIDDHAHVNDFMPSQQFDATLEAAGFTVIEGQENAISLDCASVQALMDEIKGIGANHVPARRQGLTTPSMLARLEAAYPRHGDGIAATWDLIYRIVERRACSKHDSTGRR